MDAWNNLGTVSGQEQNYDAALDEFQHAARANPNNLLAVENMVRIYHYQNRPADCQKMLEELVLQAPSSSDLHLGLAMTLVAQNNMTGARKELETAVRLRPDNVEAINNLGAVLLSTGNTQEALARFEEGMRMSPDFDRPYINAATIYSRDGQSAKARQLLEKYLALHPDDADVRSALDKLGSK